MKYFRPAAIAAIALSGLFLTGSLFAQSSANTSTSKNREEYLQNLERKVITLTRTAGRSEDVAKEVRQLRTQLNNFRNTRVIRVTNTNESNSGFLGIVPGGRSASGVTISTIVDNSGAEKAGLREGDVIIALDGKKVQSHSDITGTISAKKANETIAVTILRDGSEQVIDATLGSRQHTTMTVNSPAPINTENFKNITINLDGVSKEWENVISRGYYNGIQWTSEKQTANPCEKLREMRSAALLGVYVHYNAKNGVGVQDIITNTGAQYSGLQAGDVITSVAGTEVRSYNELRRAVVSHKPGETVVVTFLRDGQVQRVNSTLSSIADTRQEVVASLEAKCNNVVVTDGSKNAPGTALPGIQSGDAPAESPLFSVSPNPTNGITTLHFFGDAQQSASVSVMDLKGSVVLTQELTAGTTDTQLDLTTFPKGMYIINVNQGEHKFSEKIVVN